MPRRDAISILKEDHKKVRALLDEMSEAQGRSARKRGRLLDEIETEILVHSKLEEEIFYPAYRDSVRSKEDKKLYFESIEEHHLVETVLNEMREVEPETDEFAAKAKVLKELVEMHVREEEREMFPKAKEHMDSDELQQLGEQIEERRPALQEDAQMHAA